jgi:hypothetical protein
MQFNVVARAVRALALLTVFTLSACGGGGGGSSSSSSGGPSTPLPAPSGLSYTTPQTFSTGAAITALSPTVTGSVTSYSVSPALPAGLALNATTGQITGTPTSATAAANYTVTASNATGSTAFALSITVSPGLPAQPTLTLSFAPKRVTLDWTAAAGATSYRVRKNPGSGFAQLGPDLTVTTFNDDVATHLTNWVNTSYVVQACNSSGCTDSAARTLVPANSAAAITQLKAAVPKSLTSFGVAVAVSADGSTLAVGAYRDDSGIAGIGGDQNDTSKPGSGAVHVYIRNGAQWVSQAFIKASNPDNADQFGVSISLSADGNTLGVGAHGESSNSGANEANNSSQGAGAGYIFVRSGTTWSQQAYIKPTVVNGADSFGRSVALSNDGNVFVAGAMNEDSPANTINGNATDHSSISVGAAYVFVRSGTTWSQETYLKASNSELGDSFGATVAISGDGQTIAVGAPGEDSNAVGVDGDATNNSAADAGAVYVFRRDSPVSWEQTGYLKASNTDAGDVFGGVFGGFVIGIQRTISLSEDGNTLAVGAFREASGTGAESDDSAANAGAVYVFTRGVSGPSFAWSQQAYLKASNPGAIDGFGAAVALSADGNRLAVGATGEDGSTEGVGSTPDNTLSDVGAAYLFSRAGTAWSQTNYIKSTTPAAFENFGMSVALSGDASSLVVGANGDGAQVSNSGAVFAY